MRRATLGSVSPAQLNSRSGVSNMPPRNATKQSRASGTGKQQPSAGAPIGSKSGRPSLSRRSSSMYGKGSQKETETRPIADKGFQQDCIRTLVNYLNSHGYSNPVSQKTFQTPSSKDVVSIIQFLFLQIDPNWEFKKIEEDVPLVFKRLGYPVAISRSALYAAGSPVSWPPLLAALTWLVDLLTAMEPSEGQGESPFDDYRGNLFTEYVNTSYYHFLKGEDDQCALLDEAYVKKVEDENEKQMLHIEKLQAEANELKEKLRKLKSEPSPLAALEAKQVDYKEDVGKFNMVISNFLSHKQAVEKKRDEKRQELATKKEEVVSLSKENEELRERVAAQQIHVAHVDKMLKEKEILEVNLQSVTGRRQELEKTAWDHEKNSSKKLRDLEDAVSQFNESCERLGPSLGEVLRGHTQLEIKLQPRADSPADILGGATKTVIKPALLELIEKTRKTLADETNPEALSLQEQVFRREMVAREKQEQISNAIAHNRKLEAQYKAREEKLDVMAIVAEREEIEARMVEEELALENEEAEVEHELREAETQLEATVKACNEEIEHTRTSGTEILEIILSTKERTQATVIRVKEVAAQSIEVFRELLSSP